MEMMLPYRQKEGEKYGGLNANTLKLVAVLAMAFQHFAIKFMSGESPTYLLFLSVGKITAPVMCFFIAEGYYHTRDRKRYLGRLFFFSFISHIPHALAFGFPVWKFWKATSVMWSLFLGLAALIIYHQRQWRLWQRILGILGCCVLAYPGNWNCVAVIWILGFGIFRDEPVKQWSVFFFGVLVNILEYFIIENDGFLQSNLAFVFPVLLLSLYNGQRGNSSRWVQKFFYWFYPLHLLLIYGIRVVLA